MIDTLGLRVRDLWFHAAFQAGFDGKTGSYRRMEPGRACYGERARLCNGLLKKKSRIPPELTVRFGGC